MAHYDCSDCGQHGCLGECRKKPEDVSQFVPTAVVPRRTPRPAPEAPSLGPGAVRPLPPRPPAPPAPPLTTATPAPINPAPVKSDGGSSSYYQVTIRRRDGQTFTCETGDIIRALVGNDFSLGNIVKACRRIHQAMIGQGKEGTSPEYDINKIHYFADEVKDHVIR